jgi:hypothetical protein
MFLVILDLVQHTDVCDLVGYRQEDRKKPKVVPSLLKNKERDRCSKQNMFERE